MMTLMNVILDIAVYNTGCKMETRSLKFKDCVSVDGVYYTLHLTINTESGEVIDDETWVEE